MICSGCAIDKPTTTGAVINGNFGQYCIDCRDLSNRQASPASAEYSRERDREDHRKDMLQPRDAKGLPSREFIQAYPNESKNFFTDKEIKENA